MNLKYTKLQILLEAAAVIILLGTFGYLLVHWPDIPDKIPMHYNAAGEADRIAPKNQILFLPLTSLFLYILITVLTFFPSSWNIPANITDENREKVYGYVKYLIILLKAEVLGGFFYITYMIANGHKSLTGWFLPVFLIVIFFTITAFLFLIVRAGKEGHIKRSF